MIQPSSTVHVRPNPPIKILARRRVSYVSRAGVSSNSTLLAASCCPSAAAFRFADFDFPRVDFDSLDDFDGGAGLSGRDPWAALPASGDPGRSSAGSDSDFHRRGKGSPGWRADFDPCGSSGSDMAPHSRFADRARGERAWKLTCPLEAY